MLARVASCSAEYGDEVDEHGSKDCEQYEPCYPPEQTRLLAQLCEIIDDFVLFWLIAETSQR